MLLRGVCAGRMLGIRDWCSLQGRPKMSWSGHFILADRCLGGQKSEVQMPRSPKIIIPKTRSPKARSSKARNPRAISPDGQNSKG